MIKYILHLFIFIFFFHLSLAIGGSFENIDYYENINSIAGVAIDGTTGRILYAKNPHIKIPPASTVKLLTAMIVLDRLPLSQKVRISKTAEETPFSNPHLYEGETYTVEDLLYLLLLKSSNQAAVALAEAVSGSEEKFSELMNQKARMIGLKDSHFVTASGLPGGNQYTTAYELALLLYEALKYPHIKEIINTPVKIITSQEGRTLVIRNTNRLLFDEDSRYTVLGGKTGYTRLSKHCLVNVSRVKDRLVITSILGAPNRESLWEDTKKLIRFSELVLEGKVSPVAINTAVNTAVPVSIKPKAYYREVQKRNHLVSQKRGLPVASVTKNKHVAQNSRLALTSKKHSKNRIQTARTTPAKNKNIKTRQYRAEDRSLRSS